MSADIASRRIRLLIIITITIIVAAILFWGSILVYLIRDFNASEDEWHHKVTGEYCYDFPPDPQIISLLGLLSSINLTYLPDAVNPTPKLSIYTLPGDSSIPPCKLRLYYGQEVSYLNSDPYAVQLEASFCQWNCTNTVKEWSCGLDNWYGYHYGCSNVIWYGSDYYSIAIRTNFDIGTTHRVASGIVFREATP